MIYTVLAADQPWTHSPGFAGLAALLAAIIAATAAWHSAEVHRDTARAQRENDQEIAERKLQAEADAAIIERCWERFEWIFQEASLPLQIRAQMLQALTNQVRKLGDRALLTILVRYSEYIVTAGKAARQPKQDEDE